MSNKINDVVINHYKNMAVSRQMFCAINEHSGFNNEPWGSIQQQHGSDIKYDVSTCGYADKTQGTVMWRYMEYHDCVYGNMKLAHTMVAMEDDYILNKVFQEAGNANIECMDFCTCGNAFHKINFASQLLASDGYPLRHGMNLAINREQYTQLVASRGRGEQTGDEMMNVMALLRGGRIFPANVAKGCGILAPIAEYSGVKYTIKRDWRLEKCCGEFRLSLALGDIMIEEPNTIVKLEGM